MWIPREGPQRLLQRAATLLACAPRKSTSYGLARFLITGAPPCRMVTGLEFQHKEVIAVWPRRKPSLQ